MFIDPSGLDNDCGGPCTDFSGYYGDCAMSVSYHKETGDDGNIYDMPDVFISCPSPQPSRPTVGPGKPAPNKGKGAAQCAATALTTDGNGLSLLGDVAGFIPGEKLLGATAGLTAVVATGVASTFNSAVHGDVTGTLAGAAGLQLSVVAPGMKYAGLSFAEAVPVIGTLLNVAVTGNDVWKTIKAFRGCMAGHE